MYIRMFFTYPHSYIHTYKNLSYRLGGLHTEGSPTIVPLDAHMCTYVCYVHNICMYVYSIKIIHTRVLSGVKFGGGGSKCWGKWGRYDWLC